MPHLLIIETSPRGASSVSRAMTDLYAEAWQDRYPEGVITRRDLMATPLEFTDARWLAAYFTPPAQQTEAMRAALALSDQLVRELVEADELVIGTPVYNYNVPAILKSWVDHIVRKGVTLGFSGEGLLTGKRATVLVASGGVYTEGSPIRQRDLATQWLRLILQVLGIGDVHFVAAGGSKAIDLGQQSREDFMAPLLPLIQAAALR